MTSRPCRCTLSLVKGPLTLLTLLALVVAGEGVTDAHPITAPPARHLAAIPALVIDDFPSRREPSPLPAAPVDTSLRQGSRGAEVLSLEQRLFGLGYLVGKIDGIFDRSTYFGVVAFQKVEGLARSGRADGHTIARLATAYRPTPRYSTPPNHLEVDIPRQVVFVVRGGAVSEILPASTGSNKLFTNDGWTRRATTPNGRFKVSRKIPKMRISPLGELYKPSYFNGGIAFHGNGSVPTYSASHGCVRLPMPFADSFFNNASPIGMVVYVYGGPAGDNPQPLIEDRPAEVEASPSPSPSPTPSPEPSPDETAPTSTVTVEP